MIRSYISSNVFDHYVASIATPFQFFRTKRYDNIPSVTSFTRRRMQRGMKISDFRPISRFISEIIQYRSIFIVADLTESRTVCGLSNGAIFNDLEQTLPRFSRSRRFLTL